MKRIEIIGAVCALLAVIAAATGCLLDGNAAIYTTAMGITIASFIGFAVSLVIDNYKSSAR